MDIEHLREFAALSRHNSIISAAKELHVVQSTFSKRLTSLEREIGVELVYRTSNSIKLTPEGKILLEWALNTINSYEQTIQAIKYAAKEHINTVIVGGNLLIYSIDKLLRTTTTIIAKRGLRVEVDSYPPHISRSIATLAANDPYKTALEGLADISLMVANEKHDWSPFVTRQLFRDSFIAFVAESSPFAECVSVSLADLQHEVIVEPPSWQNYHARFIEVCRLAGFEPTIRIRIANTSENLYIASQQNEVFIFAKSSVDLVNNTTISGLIPINIIDSNAYFEIWAVYLKDSTNPGIPIFLEALDAALEIIQIPVKL
ncbi:MAG: LysR family transcriptional regulator [Coriobacteriales bacterium]|jgi:DNA-binding transcriptional LysR family regulator|nr:LysR family transcriptional regulator [Coriobacteriales bacterium]